MSSAIASKADLPKGTPIYRNDRDPKPCQIGDGKCGSGVAIVAGYRICQRHIDRIASIAEDAGVSFNAEAAA